MTRELSLRHWPKDVRGRAGEVRGSCRAPHGWPVAAVPSAPWNAAARWLQRASRTERPLRWGIPGRPRRHGRPILPG